MRQDTAFRGPGIAMIVLAVFLSVFSHSMAADAPDIEQFDSLNYDDGPHVLFPNDSTAIVFYYCQGEITSNTVRATDTLQFTGFCEDTSIAYVIPRVVVQYDRYTLGKVSKVLAISDIHGEFDHFFSILSAAEAIDADGRWVFGDGHLVINGDVFDRGAQVTECLWLIHQLQLQATKAGGAVHLLFGNHEHMVLRGDNRYIHPRYLDGIVKKSRIKHEDLYGPDMALGQWLRSCPVAIVINDVLYNHAGLSPDLTSEWTLESLNHGVTAAVDMSSPKIAFSEPARMLVGSLGPLWYRGYFGESSKYSRATTAEIDQVLEHFGVSAVVVGHSGVDSVASLYETRVYAIDVDVPALGSLEALLEENGQFWRIAGDGSLHQVGPFIEP